MQGVVQLPNAEMREVDNPGGGGGGDWSYWDKEAECGQFRLGQKRLAIEPEKMEEDFRDRCVATTHSVHAYQSVRVCVCVCANTVQKLFIHLCAFTMFFSNSAVDSTDTIYSH